MARREGQFDGTAGQQGDGIVGEIAGHIDRGSGEEGRLVGDKGENGLAIAIRPAGGNARLDQFISLVGLGK